MAFLQVSINPNIIQEGEGTSFTATFTLIEVSGDPATPDHSFNWSIGSPFPFFETANLADADFPSGFSGTVSFSGYGNENAVELIIATPLQDEVEENDEAYTFNIDTNSFSGTNGITYFGATQTFLIVEDECFLEGTNILTEQGYRRIEELKIGDKVKTFDGKLEEIKWIGKQTRHRFTAHPLRSLPIQIKAGALGNNLPHRDLFVSPDHSVLIEGLLINAGALENGISIVKTHPNQYIYYHIELENHALLDAEGVPAESFFPNKEDRSTYDNSDEYEKLYPQGSNLMFWPMDYPRISSKNKVPLFVSEKLMKIANQLNEEKALHTA
ncbi:hypothetical protein Xen7305DRAFT_00035500 [Xenococcus sp. PCC 7305]|uniref:Hint domain-containing protein n=1 Tax=Xenococcus sp. PCC 7305 TaxID=102125 RepID=UPI0002ABBB79|nr:Hint domain-containing protein [Xenococcus sp. PCC 7305]ELS03826.1 hypothetical protein Xen7305DRAFT_00035500 [Xenococcus sp. PCC 7305]